MEEIVAVVQEVVRLVPQERVPQRTVEHVPVPHILEETVEVVRLVPQERVQQRIDEQMVELLIPRIVEVNVDVVRLVPQQRVQRICEQTAVKHVSPLESTNSSECGKPVESVTGTPDPRINLRQWNKNAVEYAK